LETVSSLAGHLGHNPGSGQATSAEQSWSGWQQPWLAQVAAGGVALLFALCTFGEQPKRTRQLHILVPTLVESFSQNSWRGDASCGSGWPLPA
jgi:hypothetical protein